MSIPFKYLQIDDWWYFPGDTGGDKNWTAMPNIFPRGLQYIYNKTGWPIFAHNKFWDHKTDYARQNGGPFNFIMDKDSKVGIPDDINFWPFLLSNAKNQWGLFVYEQDFLWTTFAKVKAIQSDISLGRKWLKAMGDAAMELDIRIQYCMSWPRHVLQSVEIPAVTQVRASRDYVPGGTHNNQWAIGDSSILAYSLGLAPSKDNFHTSQKEGKCKLQYLSLIQC